jgi:membrane protein DedA with SNARE-associated domain
VTLESLIATYGYAAVVLGTFLEGETTALLAGFAAHRGYLELHWVIVAAFCGTFAADQFYFHIGRWQGTRFLERRPKWKTRAARVTRLLDMHQTLVILSFRFLYGLRTVAPFAIGLSGVSPLKYLLLTATSAGIWAYVVSSLGFLFGHAIEQVLQDLKRYEMWALGAVIVLIGTLWAVRYVRSRSKTARAAQSSSRDS